MSDFGQISAMVIITLLFLWMVSGTSDQGESATPQVHQWKDVMDYTNHLTAKANNAEQYFQ